MTPEFYQNLGAILRYFFDLTKTPIDNKVSEGIALAFQSAEETPRTVEDAGKAFIEMLKEVVEKTPNGTDDKIVKRLAKIEKIMASGGYDKNGVLDYAKVMKQLWKLFKDLKG